MKVIKIFDIETLHARFRLTISEMPNGKGYVGEYYGTTPKFASRVQPGEPIPMMKDMGSGKLTNKDLKSLIAACREEIEKRDGKIEETIEREV